MEKVGWIGTGVMGSSMCKHIIKAGHEVQVYNRTRSKAEPLLDMGAQWGDFPADVARQSDYIFTIVGYPEDVEEVMLGESGVIDHAKSGTCIADMTTSTPSLAEQMHATAEEKGIQMLDAPVSGGDVGAEKGTLAIMAGGEKDTFRKVLPFWL